MLTKFAEIAIKISEIDPLIDATGTVVYLR